MNKNIDALLDATALKSAETLSVSIPIAEGIDILKMKDTIIADAERQLACLSNNSQSKILMKKYIYEISEIYPVSDIVLIKRVDRDITDELELTDKQFIVNANRK
jgi:hypothetical protein